jgi:tRNA threonylcarbamoyladenosine biosynthesis protein TsaB
VEYKLSVRVLAVDTTTPRGSLAVVGERGVEAEERETATHGHSRWLLAGVERMLRGLGLEAQELDGFAVTVGPGSFTGLRVGMSSVQGLALAAGRPCIGRPSLDILARSAVGQAPLIMALVDAVRGEVFSGLYDGAGSLRDARRAGPVRELVGGLEDEVAFVGDGSLRHRSEIESLLPSAVFPNVDLFLAAELGRVAVEALRAGEGVAPDALRPLYLRGAHIRKPRR